MTDTLPTVQHGHSVAARCLAGVLITGQISPQEVSVVWGAMGHCHGSPGAVRRAEPTAACRSLWSANWYPDCSPLRITSVSLLNEPTLKKSSQIFHLNVFCLVFRKEKELTHPGFIGLNLPHRSFLLPRSSQNVTVRRRKNVTKFGGRGEAAMWQHPLVGPVLRRPSSAVEPCVVHLHPHSSSPGSAW